MSEKKKTSGEEECKDRSAGNNGIVRGKDNKKIEINLIVIIL